MKTGPTTPKGRPLEAGVTRALLLATLEELAAHGFEKTTIAAIAARAGTSKQAVYRRFETKSALVAAAVRRAIDGMRLEPPRRTSVAADLQLCLAAVAGAFQETPLGGSLRALVPFRFDAQIAGVLDEAETLWRLTLRQILIATPFEADMEIRIDLLLGLVWFRLLARDAPVTPADIETAILLVLGLVAPRDPDPLTGLPGL